MWLVYQGLSFYLMGIMIKDKNKFTGQERAGHKPICCVKCGMPGGIKGTPSLVKRQDGTYVHQRKCPMQGSYPFPERVVDSNVKLPSLEKIARVQATKAPDERMA